MDEVKRLLPYDLTESRDEGREQSQRIGERESLVYLSGCLICVRHAFSGPRRGRQRECHGEQVDAAGLNAFVADFSVALHVWSLWEAVWTSCCRISKEQHLGRKKATVLGRLTSHS